MLNQGKFNRIGNSVDWERVSHKQKNIYSKSKSSTKQLSFFNSIPHLLSFQNYGETPSKNKIYLYFHNHLYGTIIKR